jgi:protein AATF/BFR2
MAVTREALGDDTDNDPFAPVEEDDQEDPFAATKRGDSDSEVPSGPELDAEIDDDEEIDSDEALGESDVERFKHMKFRGSKRSQNRAPTSEDDESLSADEDNKLSAEDDDTTDHSEMDVDTDNEEAENDDFSSVSSATPSHSKPTRNLDRDELRRQAQSASTAGLAAALSAGANADVKKGQAVKQQRQAFDRLLDARIKMQRGIASLNELPADSITDDEVRNAVRQAEDAALSLWSTIDSIRCSILSAQKETSPNADTDTDSSRRKRPLHPTGSTSINEICRHTASLDASTHTHARTTLDKWHVKTQPILDSQTTSQRSKLLAPSQPAPSRLTDILDNYLLSSSSNLISQSYDPSTSTYNDSQFYQSLLRDLISTRTSNTATSLSLADSSLPQKLHPSGSAHKKIDTKASKGRKIRYTVHEKLENFMAAEDRGTWTESARAEFFGSLLGRVGLLDERVDEDEDGESGDEGREGEALRLFRS